MTKLFKRVEYIVGYKITSGVRVANGHRNEIIKQFQIMVEYFSSDF